MSLTIFPGLLHRFENEKDMKVDYNILKRYLEIKGPETDKSLITGWFSSIDAEKDLREKSRQYWEEMEVGNEVENYDESMVLGKIYRAIKLNEEKVKPKTLTFIQIIGYLSKIAAVLFIPLLLWHFLSGDNVRFSGSEITYTEIYSPLGSRTIFYLPDGSKGWLNGGTYLKYPEGFPGKTRNVSLKGEAFFDIKTNPKKPFVVSGKNLDIVATGTSFNVLAWDYMPETEIVLATGKLDIYHQSKEGQKLIASLAPGEMLHRMPGNTGSYIEKVDVTKHISWTEGKLIFRDDPFIDVVQRINRWYNVNIVIKDEILKTYQYVATFQDETLDEVLKMLAISAPICYKNIPRKQLNDGTFEKRTVELYYKPSKKGKN